MMLPHDFRKKSPHDLLRRSQVLRPLCIELTDALPPDIDAGILISEDVFATMGADPLLLAKLQILVVAAAVVAGLAGWVPLIHLDEVLALLFQLVFEKLLNMPNPLSFVALPRFRL